MAEQKRSVYDGPQENEKPKEAKYVAPRLEEIKRDINSLQADVVNLAADIGKTGVDKAQGVISYVNQNIDSLKSSGTEALEKVEGRIKSKPGQSVTIAFVAGMLASYLFSRRR